MSLSKSGDLKSGSTKLHNSLPAIYLRMVMDIVAERGVDPSLVFRETRLSASLLDMPELRVSAAEAAKVVFNAFQLTGDRSLGLEFGLCTKATAHGYLGYAAMACATLGEAVDLALRFVHLRQRDLSAQVATKDDLAIITFTDNHDLGPLRSFFFECLSIGIIEIFTFLLGEEGLEGELWFDWAEPDYFEKYRSRLWFIKFGKPAVQLRFPAAYLQHRLVMADPMAVKQAVAQCEREIAMIGSCPENLLERVRAALRPSSDGYPDLDSVAFYLSMSGRTLKRKLKERGVSFKQMLDEVRYKHALTMLDKPGVEISDICIALGYHDRPSFTRAFKRWSGKTPSDMRRDG